MSSAIGEHAEELYRQAALVALVREQDISKPSMTIRPRLFLDGDRWCALFGENIQDGVAGFGSSPARAYADFDRNWMWSKAEKESYDISKVATSGECEGCDGT